MPSTFTAVKTIVTGAGAVSELGVVARILDDETSEHIVEETMSSGSLKANPLKVECEHVRKLLEEIVP